MAFAQEGAGRRVSFRNPFLRLGTALLAPLALACPVEDGRQAPEPAPHKQSLTGTYDCVCTKTRISAYGEAGVAGSSWRFSIHENNAKFFLVDDATGMLRQFGIAAAAIPVTPDDNGFHLVSKSPAGISTITGRFSEDGSLAYTKTRAFEGGTTTFEGRCVKAGAEKYMKAVFIRPGADFYHSLGAGPDLGVPRFGGGTLPSFARDLLRSGVTDVFIAFKTDYVWTSRHDHNNDKKFVEGHPDDLLYDSRFDANEEHSFAQARKAGFDPVGALMAACGNAYASAGKKVRFHAWFPVFVDEHAVRFAFQRGYAERGAFGNGIAAVLNFISGKGHDCQSRVAAEPSNPVVVAYELAVLNEIVAKCPSLSGINLDYIRYSFNTDPCYEGGDPTKPLRVHAWNVKAAAIEGFVKKVRAEFPKMILSADVFAESQMREAIGQDGILQYLDVIMPILRAWSRDITNPASRGVVSDLASDLNAAKEAGPAGYAIFTYELLLSDASVKNLASLKGKIGY